MVGNRTIDLICSGNISTTPRARLFIQNGQKKGWSFRVFNLDRSPQWRQLDEKLIVDCNLEGKVFSTSLYKPFSIGRWLWNLARLCGAKPEPFVLKYWYLKKRKSKNPVSIFSAGAFPLIRHFEEIIHVDVEDFYPGEQQTINENSFLQKRFENQVEKVPVFSFSSPLFLPNINGKGFLVPNFSESWKPTALERNEPILSIVWFGQIIGPNRGLEQVIQWVQEIAKVELVLFGVVREEIRKLADGVQQVKFAGVRDEEELNQELSKFDVGLVADTGANWNNEILWSNKIAAYFQKGLPVLWSKTQGNKTFAEEFNVCGVPYSNKASFIWAIKELQENQKALHLKALHSAEKFDREQYTFGKTFDQIEKCINSISSLGSE